MNLVVLVGIIFIAILLVITAFVVIAKKSKPKKVIKSKKIEDDRIDFEDLMAIAKNPKTTTQKLFDTLQKFNDNFMIDDENEQKYLIFLSRCLTHKNVNADLFRFFHKEIKTKNKNYKKELEIIERKALG